MSETTGRMTPDFFKEGQFRGLKWTVSQTLGVQFISIDHGHAVVSIAGEVFQATAGDTFCILPGKIWYLNGDPDSVTTLIYVESVGISFPLDRYTLESPKLPPSIRIEPLYKKIKREYAGREFLYLESCYQAFFSL